MAAAPFSPSSPTSSEPSPSESTNGADRRPATPPPMIATVLLTLVVLSAAAAVIYFGFGPNARAGGHDIRIETPAASAVTTKGMR